MAVSSPRGGSPDQTCEDYGMSYRACQLRSHNLRLFDALEDVRDRRTAQPAEVQRQRQTRVGHLVLARVVPELPHDLDRLIDARRAERVAARLQPAERADRQATVAAQRALGGQLPALAARRETRRL